MKTAPARPAASRTRAAAAADADAEALRRATALVAAAEADPTVTPVALRRFSPEEVARRIVEEQRLCDATPIGETFYSELLGMNQLKTRPFTEQEVYDSY
jgi:hypothetical protein